MLKNETDLKECVCGLRMAMSEGVVGLVTTDLYKLGQDAERSR